MNYQKKERFLVVVIDSKTDCLASQIMDVGFNEALGVFHHYIANLFRLRIQQRAMQNDNGVQFVPDAAVSEYLRLVSGGFHDEAYGYFVEQTKKSDMQICGIYRYAQKVFKKQRIKVIKGVL